MFIKLYIIWMSVNLRHDPRLRSYTRTTISFLIFCRFQNNTANQTDGTRPHLERKSWMTSFSVTLKTGAPFPNIWQDENEKKKIYKKSLW